MKTYRAHKCRDIYCQYYHEANTRRNLGEHIRTAAMIQPSGMVKVCFQGNGSEVWVLMDSRTYDGIELLKPASIADYKAIAYVNGDGPIVLAKVPGFYGAGAAE